MTQNPSGDGNISEHQPDRLSSLDTYRGFVMTLMAAELLHWGRVASQFPESSVWKFINHHTSHVAWYGCSLHDLIQPSFSFMVGVALPYSIASRQAKGQSQSQLTIHALWRALALIFLGIFLRSVGAKQTNFTFEDTLTQIGLGYPFLFILGFYKFRTQLIGLFVVLIGYWAAWAIFPLPGPNFDYSKVGVPPDWAHHSQGFAAHWNKNSNLGAAFDVWFLNLFPRVKEFTHNGGGYLTLSFIPTLGTMILGSIAGLWLKSSSPPFEKIKKLLLAGALSMLTAWILQTSGLCPIVKRIWTPSWTLFSGGWCFFLMALFYALVDVMKCRTIAFPLIVVGMNSIAIYCLVHLIDGFIISSMKTHLGQDFFKLFGVAYEPLFTGSAALLVFWLILFWMYRKKLFIKI